MKLITAIIKAEHLDEVTEALVREGVRGLTVTEVRGFGQQHGQIGGETPKVPTLLRKIRLDTVVQDDESEAMTETITKHAHTGIIGDGKIWVSPVDSVLRIRTGERDQSAV